MRKIAFRLAALALSVLMLAGCAAPSYSVKAASLPAWVTPYDRMEYQRPDPARLRELAQTVLEQTSTTEAREALDAFYEGYDRFYTNCSLAELRSCADLTNEDWSRELEYCFSVEAEAEQIKEALMESLAQSDLRVGLEQDYFGTGYFRTYDQESFYTPELMELLQQEKQLESEYYAFQEKSGTLGGAVFFQSNADKMADILVELIRVRQQMAAQSGFDSYPEFANGYYYYREYTPDMIAAYLRDVQQELVPMYREYHELAYSRKRCPEKQMLAYVEATAKALGGKVEEAWQIMTQAGLCDLAYNRKKYDSSFEVYLYSYQEPFVFLNPAGDISDQLTLTHEFGHFCNDYACQGSGSGIDVMEVFSQGLEYLSLCLGPADAELVQLKMADSLCTFVEQSCYAAFEQQMYELRGDDLNRQALYQLYEETAKAYGMDDNRFDPRELVTINHFYTNPMYVISYVFSNDAAMQFYGLEKSEAGQGTALYLSLLDKDFSYFLEFLEEAGLESPFALGRVQALRQELENGLKH